MKKITFLTLIVLSMFYLYSCKDIGVATGKASDNDSNMEQTSSLDESDIEEDINNDLLYRDYDSGVKLTENTTMIINIPEFDSVEDSDISIVIINNSEKTIENTIKYNEEVSISYTVKDRGVYTVYAIIKDKNGGEETSDLTGNLSFETNYSSSDSNYVY